MKESQNIEWKSSWQDEYLKGICGFANAQGDRIYIGKDDSGDVVGIPNARKLLEDLPNKIRDRLGLMPHINLLQEAGKPYMEIIVEPSSVPISLRGSYYWRSGSVKQELKGQALREMLLKALVHRNYLGSMIQMKVYDDRLTLWNSGVLPEELSIEKLFKQHESIPRNPLIAEVCYKAGYIDSRGRGVEKITEVCRVQDLPVPEFYEPSGGLVVELRKTPVKTPDAVIKVLREEPTLTLAEVSERIGKSLSAVERAARKLREQGVWEYIGPQKGGHWRILD
jgi:predicted HTH transcriptional regulator